MPLPAIFRPELAAPPSDPGEAATLYKGLGRDAESIFGGHAYWNLPDGDAPGEWMPPAARLCPGAAGYHLAGAGDLLRHWLAPRLFVAEGRCESGVLSVGTALVFREARLVREIRWDRDVALTLYRYCLEHAVAQARRHGDFVDEARHRRLLADARSRYADRRWHDIVRLGLADLAVAVGGIGHRAERRRGDRGALPRQEHIERAHAWQARRFLHDLDTHATSAKEDVHA
jgi:hypothetical protein